MRHRNMREKSETKKKRFNRNIEKWTVDVAVWRDEEKARERRKRVEKDYKRETEAIGSEAKVY